MKRAPAKTATREATATTTIRKRRLSNVQARSGESLTSTEEAALRMHHGVDAGLHQPLPTNAINAAIRQQLLEIERRAYEMTGRHLRDDENGDTEARAPSAKDKIVAQLKTR